MALPLSPHLSLPSPLPTILNLDQFNLDGTLGVWVIGTTIGVFLFGMLTLQTFYYYREFSDDSRLLKVTVAIIWLLELGHTVTSQHAIYLLTVTLYGQPASIASPPHSFEIPILFSGVIYTIVQTFFANRVRVISGHWYILLFAGSLGLLRFTGDIWLFALMEYYSRLSILLEWRWLVTASLSVELSLDIIITASLCYYLKNMGAEFKQTRTTVDTLLLWSIESTLITSAACIVQIITFMTRSDQVWVGFFLIQGKLFSNTMMASLNGRQRFRGPSSNHADLSSYKSDFTAPSMNFVQARRRRSSASTFRTL